MTTQTTHAPVLAPVTPAIPTTIARALGISPQQVSATIALLDVGNTIPFIARYRKEVTQQMAAAAAQAKHGIRPA